MQIRPIAVQNGLGGAVGDDLAFFQPDHAGAEFLYELDLLQKIAKLLLRFNFSLNSYPE